MVVALALALSAASLATGEPTSFCHDMLPSAPRNGMFDDPPVTPLDLARLRDFGRQESGIVGEAPFSVSPDGRSVALVLRRADPASDSYCMAVVVVPIDGGGAARIVDVGGDPILAVSDVRGLADLPIGNLEAVVPQWSPDGQWLAYIRRDHGLTQAWKARADGSGSQQVSKLAIDVRAVRWSPDGAALIVTTRPGVADDNRAFLEEERRGFLFDKRFWPLSRSRPVLSASNPLFDQAIDANDGRLLEHDAAESKDVAARPPHALAVAERADGAIAWTSPIDPSVILGGSSLQARIGETTFVCRAAICSDHVGPLWWGEDEALYFLQGAVADNGGVTTLARWRPKQDTAPVTVLSTTDAIFGCTSALTEFVCAREIPTHPRTIVRIDPATGTMATLFDPNPEFARLRKGEVRRLTWRVDDDTSAYGDLVLPPGHRAGDKHPLIVVQYRSRGFLRGGTGDEYPIHALASRGFAVLSVERTQFVAAGKTRSMSEFLKMSLDDFAERRRVLASIEAGVRSAIRLGVVDPERIGITGLSDGAATVQFALINSSTFAAAAISSCCDEPSTMMFAADRGYGDMMIEAGVPPPGTDGTDFWRHYSLAANAQRLRTPILLQLPEDEFRFGLETFVTLDHHQVPVEMYIYADGYHQKWRPAQRLASYRRAIDWFDFWLNERVDPDPTKVDQYTRWEALKDRLR